MEFSTLSTRENQLMPCLKVHLAKYSCSVVQNNGNDNASAWTHNTSKNLVAVLDLAGALRLADGSGVVLQIVNITKVLV